MGVSANIVVTSAVNAIPKVDCWQRRVCGRSGRIVDGNAIAEVRRRRWSECANSQGRERKWQEKFGD